MTETSINEKTRNYLRLHLTDGIGAKTFSKLLKYFGDAKSVLDAAPGQLSSVPGIGTKIAQKGIVPRPHLHHQRLFLSDGLKFLWELKFRFSTPKVKATDVYGNPNIVDCRPARRWKCIQCGMMVYSCDPPLQTLQDQKGRMQPSLLPPGHDGWR